jgi:hypothetical protein
MCSAAGEALESLLLRNDFVDAQVLSAIWPVEFDRYKVLIVRVDHNGRIESFTSFRSEVGPVDEQGDWAGEEVIFTLQVSTGEQLSGAATYWRTYMHSAFLPASAGAHTFLCAYSDSGSCVCTHSGTTSRS